MANSRSQNSRRLHHQVKWEWMSLCQIELVWVRVRVEWECFWWNLKEDNNVSESKMTVSNPTWQNSRWLPSSSWVRMNMFVSDWISLSQSLCKMAVSKMAEFKMAAIIKLSQNELVWVRVRVKWECFSMNLREDNEMSESKMAVSECQYGRIQDRCLHQVKWEWMSFCQIELVWVRSEWSESVFQWIWKKITRCLNPRWQCLNPTWQNSRWLPSSS